jgi:hypothetical protein
MPRPKTLLRDVLAAFRERGVALTSHELWEASVRLRAPGLRKKYPHEETRLLTHRDVLVLRLVDGQPTLVHRDLWPDLLAVALSGAPWQLEWLPPKEARLLEVVEEEGVVRLDQELALRLDAAPKNLGRSLVSRLLVLSSFERLERGTARTLVSWWDWAEKKRAAPGPDEAAARARLDAATEGLATFTRMPWHHRSLRRRWGW